MPVGHAWTINDLDKATLEQFQAETYLVKEHTWPQISFTKTG